MARVRFIGPSAKRRLELPDGSAQTVSRGDVIEVDDAVAAGLLNTGYPRMWEAADGGHTTSRMPGPSLLSEQPRKSRMGKEDR